MAIGERIKKLREARNMTQQELAERVGYKTASAINKIELGLRDVNQSKVVAFSVALGTTPEMLMGWDTDKEPEIPASGIHGTVPVIDGIAAGLPVLAEENIVDYMLVTVPNASEYFALVVHGESMIGAGIPDGAKVLIHIQHTAEDGQIVACRMNGDEATLKRFKQKGATVFLLPENPAYEPFIVPTEDFENGEAEILGVVKQIIIDVV